MGFKWTYHCFWGLEDVTAVFVGMWDQLKTNKKVGAMWPNDADGLAWADPKTGQPPMLKAAGYTVIDGGRYPGRHRGLHAADQQVQGRRRRDPQRRHASRRTSPTSGSSRYQQGFKPDGRHRRQGAALPAALEALGDIGYGLTSECWWSPNHPFKSSLTGQTCQELADAYETATGKQWTQPMLHYAVFEVVADALKRATNVDDKQTILDAIKATDMNTISGHITWSAGAPLNPVPNVCTHAARRRPVDQGDEVPVRPAVVDNAHAKEVVRRHIPTNGK